LTAAALLALLAGVAAAQEASAAAGVRGCLDAAERDPAAEAACAGVETTACLAARPEGETPEGLAACAAAEAAAWDAVLAGVEAEVVALVRALAAAEDPEAAQPGPREALLVAAQAAWGAFRDADCAEEAALWEAGPMRDAAAAQCRTARTAERTRELLAKRRAHENP
jgi:uncharacterized protein YecT (DUF1311 family)